MQGRRARWARMCVAGVALAALVGCASESVDARVDRLVREASERANVNRAPELSREVVEEAHEPIFGNEDALVEAGRVKRPDTVNPDVEALQYAPAAEDRNVRAALESYAERYGGTLQGPGTPGAMTLSIEESLRQAQRTSTEFLGAQEDYIISAIRLLQERHLWGPRLFNDTTLALSGSGVEGDYDHALDIINALRVNQRLPTGGSVEARWVWNATEQLRETAGGRYRQSSELVLAANIPLLRGAGDVAQEQLIQAERNLVYSARDFERFRREFLVAIATDYFDLLEARARIINQQQQIESLNELVNSTQARVRAGSLQPFETDIAQARLLSGEANLESLRESYILAQERFKIRLGLRPDTKVVISEEIPRIPEPSVEPEDAARIALEYRLDLQNRRDRVEDTWRAVANARNDLLPDLNLSGEVGIPTDPTAREGGVLFSPEDLDYRAAMTLSLPLDREGERLQLRAQVIAAERSQREYERSRDEVVVDARAAVRAVELARFSLQLAERQVQINERRRESQLLRAAEVDAQTRIDTENALLQARIDRDRSVTELRTAVLRYLLATDQLRVARDGGFEPLPGM